MLPLLLRCVVASGICVLLLASIARADEPAGRVLMITQSKGYPHSSVTRLNDMLSVAEVAMTQLGQDSGLFTVHCSKDAAIDFTRENLAKYNVVMFYTTGDLPIAPADLDYFFNDWLKQPGHGFIGFHSATDTYGNYEPYFDMVGGTFNGHPWNAGDNVTISVHEPEHPAMKSFGTEFVIKDEIYQYKNWQPDKVRVLMSLNMAKTSPKGTEMVPVAWVKEYGQGRVFVTNLGHNETTWADPRFLGHVTGAMHWILGQAEADATPNPELQQQLSDKAKADAAAAQ